MRGVIVLSLLLAGAAAHADEDRFGVGLRVGGLLRDDRGYGDHASAFGFSSEAGPALRLTGEVLLVPRLRLLASIAGAFSTSRRRFDPEDALTVTNQMYTLGLGATVHRIDVGGLWVALEASAAAGLYVLGDDLNGLARSSVGPGVSVGGEVVLGGDVERGALGYMFHATRAHLADRLGGELGGGGHEIGFEMGLRF